MERIIPVEDDTRNIKTLIAELREKNKKSILVEELDCSVGAERVEYDHMLHNGQIFSLVLDTTGYIPTASPANKTSGELARARKNNLPDEEWKMVDKLQELIYGVLLQQYVTTQEKYVRRFIRYLDGAVTPHHIVHFKYPLLELYVRDPRLSGVVDPVSGFRTRFYGFVSERGNYETSITRPRLYRDYLRRQIRHLLVNHAPVVRVRPGPRVIPIHFCIEAWDQRELDGVVSERFSDERNKHKNDPRRKLRATPNEIRLNFDVPNLGEIADVSKGRETEVIQFGSLEYINEVHFRTGTDQYEDVRRRVYKPDGGGKAPTDKEIIWRLRLEERAQNSERLQKVIQYRIKPLALFDGDRIDYSLGRLRHYTKTLPKHFQNFVIFTNYQRYADRFLEYCVSNILVGLALEDRIPIQPALKAHLVAVQQDYVRLAKEEIQKGSGDRKFKEDASARVDTFPGQAEIVVPLRNPLEEKEDAVVLTKVRVLDTLNALLADGCAVSDPGNRPETGAGAAAIDIEACIFAAIRAVFPHHAAEGPMKSDNDADSPVLAGMDERLQRQEDALRAISRAIFSSFLKEKVGNGVLGADIPPIPAYHLVRADNSGISMVNIGMGPSNTKTMTDHLAVLRPHIFLMLGHCAGLRSTQDLGHYVLATGYLRVDRVLDEQLRLDAPVPPVTVIHDVIAAAFRKFSGSPEADGPDFSSDEESSLSSRVRTGTVASVMDRNWELTYPDASWPIHEAKCIGLDMESATVAANGYRLSVPYATFLCVSDRPLHGDLKLPGMADEFYNQYVTEHFDIAIRSMETLAREYPDGVPTRRLRGTEQPAFQ